MAKKTGHQDKVEPVTNCDRLPNNKVIVTAPIESRIITIRGKQIMIDRDLAELYGVDTKTRTHAVTRNMERFPERFRFQLTKEEMAELVANSDRFNSLKHSTACSHCPRPICETPHQFAYLFLADVAAFRVGDTPSLKGVGKHLRLSS